jgi:hypothetical protein
MYIYIYILIFGMFQKEIFNGIPNITVENVTKMFTHILRGFSPQANYTDGETAAC